MTLEEALTESLKLKGGNFLTSALRKWSLDWSKYSIIQLNKKLLENEDILFAADILTSTKHIDQTHAFLVVSNLRIISYYDGNEIEHFDTLPLSKIQTIETGGSDLSAYVSIISLTDTFQVFDKPAVITKLHDVLNDLLYKQNSTDSSEQSPHSPASPINENSSNETDTIQALKSYKELLDAGVITQEEFEKKKTQLLNL